MLFSISFHLLLAVPLALASPTPGSCQPASSAALAKEKKQITASGLVADFFHTFNPTVRQYIYYTT